MDNSNGDYEQKPLSLIINELVQGKELVNQLRPHLDKSSSSTTGEYLIEMALTSFDKALSMINQFGSSSSSDNNNNNNNNNNNIPQSVGGNNITSPNSAGSTGSPQSDDSGHGGDMYKKRKVVPQWTKQVKVSSDTGFEGPLEDGYSWRKYGQKAIQGATYPRGYYRCTYLHSQGCLARKHVQRSTNPSIFNVNYRGKHTCIQAPHLMQASQSPSKQTFQNQEYPYQYQDQKPSKEVVILNFGTGLSIKTEDLDTQELTINPSSFSFSSTSNATGGCMRIATTSSSNDHNTLSPLRKHGKSPLVGNYSPTFLSPTCSESNNYFSECQQVIYNKTELNEIGVVSAATSGSSSPIMDMADFQLDNDPFDFESNFFPFDIQDFIS